MARSRTISPQGTGFRHGLFCLLHVANKIARYTAPTSLLSGPGGQGAGLRRHVWPPNEILGNRPLDIPCHTWYAIDMTSETRVIVRVERSLKQVCERIAASKDETISQVLRRALRDYAATNAQLELPKKGKR